MNDRWNNCWIAAPCLKFWSIVLRKIFQWLLSPVTHDIPGVPLHQTDSKNKWKPVSSVSSEKVDASIPPKLFEQNLPWNTPMPFPTPNPSEPGSKLLVLGMVIQPLIGNPYNGYINPYYWVDDHPLLYGNIGSLDPIPSGKRSISQCLPNGVASGLTHKERCSRNDVWHCNQIMMALLLYSRDLNISRLLTNMVLVICFVNEVN